MCADITIQQDVIRLLTYDFDRHFSSPQRLGRMAPSPDLCDERMALAPTRGLMAFASTMINTFWNFVDDSSEADGTVENIYGIVSRERTRGSCPGMT
jgi:hypothetical protein